MDFAAAFAVLLCLCLLALNSAATVAVRRSTSYTEEQERLQVLLIWLVPLLGAGFVLHFITAPNARPELDGEPTPPGGGGNAGMSVHDMLAGSDR